MFYLNGYMLDNDRWKIVSDKKTYSEVGMYCNLTRQCIAMKKESIVNKIKESIDINDIRGILNGSLDVDEIIGEKQNG